MIRHKAIFKVFFIITALCLGTPSEAGIPCIWCDNELLQRFIDCCTQRMANNPNFKTCSSSMEEMKTDLLEAAKGMKNNGPAKENVMKGAMGYSIAACISGTDGNPVKKISDTRNILKQCYRAVNKKPDDAYIKEVIEIIKDKLEEKGNPSNVQQPKKETQSDEIPQVGQDNSPSQYNNSPPQQVADSNQGKNQWNGPYDKNQQQRLNFQPNPSQGSANIFSISSANPYANPYGTPQKPPALPYNAYLGKANPNQPYYPYNQKYNNQGNPSAYPIAYQNNPLNTANSNTAVSAASLSYASNEPQSQKGYNTPYASSFASAASQTTYNYPPQNYDYNPNSPPFNAAAASSASSSATNYDGNNAASSSSGSYSIANSDQKSFPFNNSNKKEKQKLLIPINRPQSESIWPPPQNQQNKWDNNPNLNPVIPNTPITQPELVKTSSVPQQTSTTATQAWENNWKINNQKNVPSTKDDTKARALRFSKTLYEVFIHDESFKMVFHEYMTKDQSKTVVPYMLYDGLSTCGYDEKTTQEFATKSISFMDGFAFPSPTSSYAEAICKMLMVQFYRSDLIGDDPYSQAADLGDAMSKALKKLVSPAPIQDNVAKPVLLSASEQNLPDYPTKSVPYDDSNSNYDAANPEVKPDSFSNKQLDQPLDLQNKSSDYSLPQTLPIQKQKNQPTVYDDSDQPTDDKAISYDKSENNKTKKKVVQSYADADDKIVYGSDDNDYDASPGQRQNQKQKNQPNTNDNSDQSPYDVSISYDKTIKNKSDKKDDPSYVNDKTDYSGYDDNNQPPNYKPVNIKQKSTNADDNYYEGSYDDDDDYDDGEDDDYDRDGEGDSRNSNGEDSKFNLRDDLGISKKKQNPGTRLFQNQKKQPYTNDNSDQSPDDKAISYDKLIKNKAYKKDDLSYVNDKTDYSSYNDKNQPSTNKQNKKGNQPYFGSTDKDRNYNDDSYPFEYYDDDDYYDDYYDNYPGKNDEDGDINPKYYLGYPEKERSPRNDYNNNDKSKYKPKQQPDILIQKADSKTNKQGYNNPDTYNVPDDNSKKILISKTLELQKDKSNPLYFPDYDKDGGQKPSKQPLPLPPIADDQQNSKLPYIGQENISTAPIKPETLKNNDLALNPDKQTDLSTDAPVFQPDISDSSTNPDFNKAKNDESKARVEILKKWALDCMKGEKFDYKAYTGVIVGLDKIVQQKHPDWAQQKSQTTVLIETIFALTQLLLKSNVKEVKGIIQQPQKMVEPVQLPPNSQWNNQNVPQKNQNVNYQSGQANKNSQPVIQEKSAVDYLAPEQDIAYPSQNQEIQQNKWDSNQNSYPVVQNTFISQPKPINKNVVPQPNIPIGTQPSAQNYNSNVGNQEWRNNGRQISNTNENSLQFRQPPPIPGQIDTNEENRKWNDKTFSIPQTVNSNAGVPNIYNFQQPLNNQANLFGVPQNGNQGIWAANDFVQNQNPNYQSGQANKNSQPGIQDKPAPGQDIAYPSQNQEQQNKWDSNQNSYPVVQNTFIPRPKHVNENFVSQPNIPIATQPSAQNYRFSQVGGLPFGYSTTSPTQAQDYNSNVGNQEWRNNGRQKSNNNENPLQFRQPPPIPGQIDTNQENEKWNDKTFSIPQTVNSNAGAPNIYNFQQPLDNQANLLSLPQNGNKGIWAANDFMNLGNPNIRGVNQAGNFPQRNQRNIEW